jgi:hypothetical protein
MQVTATQGGFTANGILLRVKVLTGAAGSPVGNTGSFASFTTGPAQCTVTTTAAGSMVYGALMGFPAAATSLTAHAGTTLLDSHHDSVNDNWYGTFATTSVTGTPGATVVGSDTPSASGGYSCGAVEILSAGTIQDDPSAPAAAVTDSAITVTSDAFTPPDGSLLLALVGSDGGNGLTTMTVDGGGVVWTELAKGQSTDGGYGGVWAAVAGSTGPNDPLITITETGSTSQGITARIKVLTGAAPSALQTGARATQSANAAHQASITTTQAGSIVYGAVIDGTNTSLTAAAGTTLFDNIADTTNTIRYGTLRTTAATGTPGAVTVGASAPTADVGSCALAEILPATPGGTINEDVSSPAVVTVLTSITCQVTVTPPPGSLLVLMVSSDGAAGITGMTVTGGGLNWRALAEGHATGEQYAGVWIADVPSGAGAPSVTRLAPFWHPGRNLPGLPGQTPFDAWPPPGQGAAVTGPVTVDSTGSSPAGAAAVTAVVTQIAPATAAGAGSVTAAATVIAAASAAGAGAASAVATQIAGSAAAGASSVTDAATQAAIASAAGAGSVSDVVTQVVTGTAAGAGAATAKAVQAAGAAAAGAGAVADVVTQIASATAAGAGSVTATGAVSGSSTASVAAAGSVSAVVTQIAPAAGAGAGAVTAAATQAAAGTAAGTGSAGPAPVTQIAPAAAAGAGAVSDVATQIAIASAAGAGSVTAAGSVTGAGATASAAGAAAVTALATQIAPVTSAGAGSVSDVATQIAKAAGAGAAAATADGRITGTANVAGAGAATAKAAQAVPAQAAGAAVLSALATQAAIAAITGAGSATAAGSLQLAFTIGTLTASTAPRAALTANGAPSAVLTAAAATATLTASTAAAGGTAYAPVYGPGYGPQEGTLTATDTRTGGPG